MNRPSDATWRTESGVKRSYCVDLIPPPEGFSDEVDEEIIEFVERYSGTFDLYGEITNRDAFILDCLKCSGQDTLSRLQRFPVDLLHLAVMRVLDPRIHHVRKISPRVSIHKC